MSGIASVSSSSVNRSSESGSTQESEGTREVEFTPPPPPPPPPPAPPPDAFVPRATPRRLELTGAPPRPAEEPAASSLLTEDIRDAEANCLDKAGDWLALASPELRARSEVLLLSDNRPGAEGQTGHAVIRQGSGIFDPSSGRGYPSLEAFNADGRYSVAGTVSGTAMHRILSTPPGSAERQAALARAGVDPALAAMKVADSAPTVDVSQAWNLLMQGYRDSRSLTGAANAALAKAAGDPRAQAQLIDLLQATPASTLENALAKNFEYEVRGAVPNPPPRPASVSSVGTTRVSGSALEVVAGQATSGLLKPALDTAVSRGHLLPADRDVLVSYLGPTGAATNARIDTAVAEVHQAEQVYSDALKQRETLETQLASDMASFGPYLTEAQQKGYIAEYRKLHASEYAGFDAKAKALNDVLKRNEPLLEQGLRGPEGTATAQVAYAAYAAVAQSPHADTALAWAAKAEKPGSAFAPFTSAMDMETVRSHAMAGSLASYFEKNPRATASQAVDHMQIVLTNAYLGQQAGGGVVDLTARNLPSNLREGFKGLRQLVAGDTQAGLNRLAALESGSSARWGGAFAAAGIGIGLMQLGHSVESGDALGAAWAAAFTGQQFTSALSSTLTAANRAGGVATVAGRVAGGFGAVAAALDLFVQAKEISAGQGNEGTALSIAGDVMGLAGGVLIALGSTGVGAPLAAIGAAVYILGELVSAGILASQEWERKEQLRQDQRTVLGKIGANVDQLMNLQRYSSPEQIDELVKTTGWSRDQVLQLGTTFPEFFQNAQSLQQLNKVANDFGLTPDQRYAMLNAIGRTGRANDTGSSWQLRQFASAVDRFPNYPGIKIPPGLTREQQWVHYLQELGNAMGSYDGMGLRNAASYLRPHAS